MEVARALLTDRVAIVTGAGRGIGKGVALAFADFGAKVVVCERREPYLSEVVETIRSRGGSALASETDARDASQVRAMVERAVAEFEAVDILVNNVGGIYTGRDHPAPLRFLETSEESWDASHALNLKTVYLCTSEVGKAMVRQGRGGSIINVSSSEGLRGAPGFAAYGAYKAAITALTKTLALELAPHNIRVNCIAPDGVATEWIVQSMAQAGPSSWPWGHIPMGRAATPDEAAGAFVFLASALSSFVTGVTLPLDGGIIAASGWVRDASGAWSVARGGRPPN
ncbi:MAG: SDR family NAD(P)-dependent oxidoreductase, partial [Dehalococcoidia bacterium]